MRSSLRTLVFWSHFVVGGAAALVLLPLSVTGVLLTYERQVLELIEQHYTVDPEEGVPPISADHVVAIARHHFPNEPHIFIRWVNREGAAVPVWVGNDNILLHPYSGEVLREGVGAVAAFFASVRSLHRWMWLSGDWRELGKAVTAYVNLLFIFLLLSGFYLWLPRRWRWHVLRRHLLLPRQHKSPRTRLRSWHYVFGIWTLLPLLIISSSATIFYFDWANDALYAAFGETVPTRDAHTEPERMDYTRYELAPLLSAAKRHATRNGAKDWHSMWMELGESKTETRFFIDRSIGHRPDYAYSLYLELQSASVLRSKFQSDWSYGDQAWDIARFSHTGEYYGFIGQTLAGLASLLVCVSIYSGLVMGWQRLVGRKIRRGGEHI